MRFRRGRIGFSSLPARWGAICEGIGIGRHPYPVLPAFQHLGEAQPRIAALDRDEFRFEGGAMAFRKPRICFK
jgi:hypothetical protein